MLMHKPNAFILVLITPLFLFIANHFVIYFHDYGHSFAAWLLGYKNNPFLINFGGRSLENILFLTNTDENVNYHLMSNNKIDMAWIALSGPGFANGFLFVLSLFLLSRSGIKQKPYLFYFIFWVNLMTLGNFYDYIPIRTFSTEDDLARIITGFNISPWYVYIIGGYLVAFAIWYFFTRTMIRTYVNLRIISQFVQAFIMILCVLTLFGYFAAAGYSAKDHITYFLSVMSMIMIPGIIIACWPTRAWMSRQFNTLQGSS